jgi:hypothetical protein
MPGHHRRKPWVFAPWTFRFCLALPTNVTSARRQSDRGGIRCVFRSTTELCQGVVRPTAACSVPYGLPQTGSGYPRRPHGLGQRRGVAMDGCRLDRPLPSS